MSLIPAFHLPGKVNVNLSSVLEQILDNRGSICNGSTTSSYDSSYQLFRIVLDIWLASCVCILGFLGNALTIVILWSDKDRRTPTNWLLQTLAVVDIFYLINSIFIQPLKTANDVTDWLHPVARSLLTHLEPYLWTMASTVQMVTVWTVMLVTLDRYIAICHPTKARLRTLDRARKSVAFILVVAVVYNLPLLFERQVSPIAREASCQPTQSIDLHYTDLRRSFLYFVIYKTIFFFVFRTIGPLLTLITLNFKLMTAVRRMRRRHSHMTSVTRQRQNVTVTLVVVVSVFIVCELPDICLRIFVTVLEMAPQFAEIYHVTEVIRYVVHPVTNILLTVNSSVNFLIYCLMAKKFRLILLRICCHSRSVHRVPGGRPSLSGVFHYHHVTGHTYAMTLVVPRTTVAG